MALRLIGSAVTDSNGVAVLDDGYTGTGAGKVDLVASVDVDGSSVVSNTYEVVDALVYDKGLEGTGNHNDSAWDNNSNLNISRGSDGTTVTNNQSGNQYLYANNGTAGLYDWATPICIEFDYEKTGTADVGIQIIDQSNNNFNQDIISTTGHYVIELHENNCSMTINDGTPTTKTVTLGNSLIRFYMRSGASFKFKDFEIYPI